MVKRHRHTLRHPFRGDRRYARPASGSRRVGPSRSRSGLRLARLNGPRMRPRRKVHVASIVTTPPEEVPSRPGVRLYVIGLVVLVLFAVMVLRLWTLQVINHKAYAAAVTSNEVRMVTVPAPRGLIVDRHDTPLVENRYQFEVLLSRVEASLHPEIIAQLAALIGKPATTIRTALTTPQYSPYQPVPVLDPATTTIVQYLDAHKSTYPGVTVTQVAQRSYPQGGTTAAQVLGYVGPITATELKTHPGYSQTSDIGKSGIEKEYEPYLRGAHGRQALEVNATGTVVGTLTQKKPSPGDTVVLNVTVGLQKAVQQALASDITADRHRDTAQTGYPPAPNGAAVVLNARTGAVLAMASYPDYSLTTWVPQMSRASLDALNARCTSTQACPLSNEAIQGLYTPGSTFKLATATAALNTGLITPGTYIDDTGTFDMRTHGFPTCTGKCNFHDATAADAGEVDMSSAITRSDDFFFYTLGVHFFRTAGRFGTTPIPNAAHQLGFGDKTGIDLPYEVQGRVDGKTLRTTQHQQTPKNFPTASWYPATALEAAFGQGETTLTPIEEAQAYATFANGGTRYQPEVAADIVSPQGKVVKKIAPKPLGHVSYNPTNWQAMLQGFIGATHTPTGTGYYTFKAMSKVPSSYVIAGKTGTATTATRTGKAPDAWFDGFGPVNAPATQPEYVVTVAVAKGGYGATGAAPAVATIFNYLYAHPVTGTPKLSTPTVSGATPGTTPSAAPGAKGAKSAPATPSTTTTPTVQGTRASPATTTAPKGHEQHPTITTTRTASVVEPATGGRSPPPRLSAARPPP